MFINIIIDINSVVYNTYTFQINNLNKYTIVSYN